MHLGFTSNNQRIDMISEKLTKKRSPFYQQPCVF